MTVFATQQLSLPARVLLLLLVVLVLVTSAGVLSSGTAATKQAKPHRTIWIDLPVSGRQLTTQAAVDAAAAKISDAGFDSIVMDVKAYTGYTAYPSRVAPHISETRLRSHQGFPPGFDLLEAFVSAGRQQGLQVYAAINVFSEGHLPSRDGPFFDDPSVARWGTTFLTGRMSARSGRGHTFVIHGWNEPRREQEIFMYSQDHDGAAVTPTSSWGVDVVVDAGTVVEIRDRTLDQDIPGAPVPVDGFVLSGTGSAREELLQLRIGDTVTVDRTTESVIVPLAKSSSATAFVNPILPAVQNRALAIIRELLAYDIDGIVLDRARYANVRADFSPESRRQFEAFLGHSVANWPEDAVWERLTAGGRKIEFGPYAQEWFHWRAANIRGFVHRVRRFLDAEARHLALGVYVGSWYHRYYSEGVNWARQGYQPDYEWVTENYHETGYANLLDFLMAGAYYRHVTAAEAEAAGLEGWRSVESGVDMMVEAVGESAATLGSLYLMDYRGDPDQFREAIRMVLSRDVGLMLFDFYHLELFDWWDIVREMLH